MLLRAVASADGIVLDAADIVRATGRVLERRANRCRSRLDALSVAEAIEASYGNVTDAYQTPRRLAAPVVRRSGRERDGRSSRWSARRVTGLVIEARTVSDAWGGLLSKPSRVEDAATAMRVLRRRQ